MKKSNDFIIVGGKIGMFSEFLKNFFQNYDLRKKFNVSEAEIEFYEFYEEMINEFIVDKENGKNDVEIEGFEENEIKKLKDDFNSLKTVREFVIKFK